MARVAEPEEPEEPEEPAVGESVIDAASVEESPVVEGSAPVVKEKVSSRVAEDAPELDDEPAREVGSDVTGSEEEDEEPEGEDKCVIRRAAKAGTATGRGECDAKERFRQPTHSMPPF